MARTIGEMKKWKEYLVRMKAEAANDSELSALMDAQIAEVDRKIEAAFASAGLRQVSAEEIEASWAKTDALEKAYGNC